MGVLSQITQTLRYLVTEKLLKGLRILAGNGEDRPENRSDAPDSTDRLDDQPLNTAPLTEGNAKQRLSSNQLGRYGNR
jgi:hypothetical protein